HPHCPAARRDLRAFPTRRSSDLMLNDRLKRRIAEALSQEAARDALANVLRGLSVSADVTDVLADDDVDPLLDGDIDLAAGSDSRSEEHTSELQSRENLVCRLLLE